MFWGLAGTTPPTDETATIVKSGTTVTTVMLIITRTNRLTAYYSAH